MAEFLQNSVLHLLFQHDPSHRMFRPWLILLHTSSLLILHVDTVLSVLVGQAS
jgi:hypothetical protein